MFKPITLVIVLCLVWSAPLSAKDRDAEVLATLDAIWGGWERGERALVEANLARDYIDTDFDGVRRTKAEVLAFLQPRDKPAPNAVITRSDYQFQYHGDDTTVVTYRAQDCRSDAKGSTRCFRFAAADTLVLEDGRWKLAAGQQTMLPADAPEYAEVSRDELLRTAAAIDDAQLKSDVPSFGLLHTADWSLTHAAGQVADKAKFMADMASFWKPTGVTHSDRSITLMANGAILSGIVEWEWRDRAQQVQRARERYTDVYIRRYGQWLRVRSHFSCVSGACS